MALLAVPALPTLGRAQIPTTPDSLRADSLAARLARAEAAIALLREQLATESQSAVRTRSRLQLELTGRLFTNAFLTLGRANSVDVPMFATAPSEVVAQDALGLTARQSRLGGVVTLADVLGGVFVGDVEIDFFGGVQTGPGDRRLFPEPRMRTTRARLRWARTEIMAGIEVPLISGVTPVSVAASGVPNFVTTGNLWNWLGQFRITHELATTKLGSHAVRWGIAGAAMAPTSGALTPGEPDGVDAGERSRRPALEVRAHAQWGDTAIALGSDATIGEGGGEIGVGVHRGWIADGLGDLQTSRAVAMDARISLTPRLELRGEAYTGRLLRGLGGGGIGQAFGRPVAGSTIGPPIRDRAGWAQLNARVHTTLLLGAGCGIDVVDENDRPVRRRNTACASHLLWRPAEPVLMGFEFRRITTLYDSGATGRASHLNLGFGFEL